MVEVTIVNGFIGGVAATVVMTVLMMALGDDSPPPTALFWSKYIGDGRPDEYMMQGMVLHFLYGIGAAAVLALALPAVGFGTVGPPVAAGIGVVYGVVLFVIAAVLWMNMVLGLDPDPPEVGMFLVFHLVYGVVLGAVVGAGVV
jgi:hypothetical protein